MIMGNCWFFSDTTYSVLPLNDSRQKKNYLKQFAFLGVHICLSFNFKSSIESNQLGARFLLVQGMIFLLEIFIGSCLKTYESFHLLQFSVSFYEETLYVWVK